MDYRQLTNILIRLAGLWVIVFSILNIPNYFLQYYAQQLDSVYMFSGVVIAPFLVTLIIGLLLFLFPSRISNKIISSSKNTENFKQNELLTLGFAITGSYLFAVSLADIVYLYSLVYLPSSPTSGIFTADRQAELFAFIVELVLGFVLLFRQGLIIQFISNVQKKSL